MASAQLARPSHLFLNPPQVGQGEQYRRLRRVLPLKKLGSHKAELALDDSSGYSTFARVYALARSMRRLLLKKQAVFGKDRIGTASRCTLLDHFSPEVPLLASQPRLTGVGLLAMQRSGHLDDVCDVGGSNVNVVHQA